MHERTNGGWLPFGKKKELFRDLFSEVGAATHSFLCECGDWVVRVVNSRVF